MGVMLGTDIRELPSRLAAIEAGEEVHLAVVTEQPVDQQVLDQITASFREGGIRVLTPAAYTNIEWEGYSKPAVYLSFEKPAIPAEGEYALWPALLLGGVLLGGVGYILWKGGQIAEETVQSFTKMAIPIILIVGAFWLGSKAISQQRQKA